MVRLELWNGARGETEMAFLSQLDATITDLPLTPDVWKLADKMARQARQKGQTFPVSDIVIAACSRFHHAQLLHCDRHFEGLLKIEV